MADYRDYDPLMGTGYFDVWLEGTSFDNQANGSFAATLTRVVYDGSAGTFNVSQAGGPLSLGATNGLRWNQTVAGSGGTCRMIEPRIEDATTFNNDQATLSFYVSSAVSGVPMQVEIVQFFGSGGNANGPGGNASADVTVFSDWFVAEQSTELRSFTFAVPSTAGKYFGANYDDCLKVRIKYPFASTFDVSVHELRLERGSVRTPFQAIPLSLKRNYIDRYIQVLSMHLGGNAASAGAYLYQSIPFKTHMRRIPTATWSGSTRANLSGGVPVVTYMKNFGGCAYISSAAAGAFYALDEYLKLDARL